MNRSFKPCLQTSKGSIIQDPQPQYERLHGAWAPRILGSTDPQGFMDPQGSMDPGLHRILGSVELFWIMSTENHGIHMNATWAPKCLSTDSADPQAPRIHNSTIQLFYIKIIMSTENHPTLMNANGKRLSIT